jgi:hypothetical protein
MTLARVPRLNVEERMDSSENGVGETEYPHAKEKNWTLILHHIQGSTQNKWKT